MVTKGNAIDDKILRTSRLVTKPQHNLDKHGLETNIENVDKRITSVSELVKKTDNNTKNKKTRYFVLLVYLLLLLKSYKSYKTYLD